MLPIRDMGPLRGRSSSVGRGLSTVNRQIERPDHAMTGNGNDQPDPEEQQHREQDFEGSRVTLQSPSVLTPEQQQRKEILQCVLLELGILFHSVFIGMALSVSIGSEFIILLIAIIFHRNFTPSGLFSCGMEADTCHRDI